MKVSASKGDTLKEYENVRRKEYTERALIVAPEASALTPVILKMHTNTRSNKFFLEYVHISKQKIDFEISLSVR